MHRLTMRSGVSPRNDNFIGDFNDAKTAYLVGELLWALDRCEHPEYRGYDVVSHPLETTDLVSNESPIHETQEGECPNCVSPWKCNGPHIGETPKHGYGDD